ncbi:MAG: hypothetical protein F6K58_10585 [Symploca sp. SIO2E9]|nr:hypothetical protein [Symploca sp. SIO2E9]
MVILLMNLQVKKRERKPMKVYVVAPTKQILKGVVGADSDSMCDELPNTAE